LPLPNRTEARSIQPLEGHGAETNNRGTSHVDFGKSVDHALALRLIRGRS
jgi:hypothetical protein